MISTPRRSASICRSYGTPPTAVLRKTPTARPSGISASLTCIASSRVGTRIRALGWCGRARSPVGEPGQQRQAEGERLAGAGLAAAEDVPAGQRVRDGRRLDLERGGDALPGQHADQRLRAGRGRRSRRLDGLGLGLDGGGLGRRGLGRWHRGRWRGGGRGRSSAACRVGSPARRLGSKTDGNVLGSAKVVKKCLSSGAHLRDGLPRLSPPDRPQDRPGARITRAGSVI